jgi:hypothetical protein
MEGITQGDVHLVVAAVAPCFRKLHRGVFETMYVLSATVPAASAACSDSCLHIIPQNAVVTMESRRVSHDCSKLHVLRFIIPVYLFICNLTFPISSSRSSGFSMRKV